MKKIITIVALSLILSSFASMRTEASTNPNRLFGNDRVETSIKISKQAYPNSKIVILAGYGGQVDSLSGTILAHTKSAPIILTRKDKLDQVTLDEITRLNPTEIYILGGETVVSKNVEDSLSRYKVTRIAGDRREQTAINIAKEAMGENIHEVFLTLGYDEYADALAIGPISARKRKPIFLTRKNALPNDTKEALKNLGIKKLTIIGGESVVNKSIETELNAMGISFNRVAGKDRMQTAINIAKEYIPKPSSIVVANGYDYADAVIGGYLAAKNNAPILLSKKATIDINSLDYIANNKMKTYILGGENIIYEGVHEDINFILNENVTIKDEETQFIEPFNIKEIKDSTLPSGEKRIKQNGVNGSRKTVDRVYYKNGEQFRRENMINTVTKEPVDQIVLIGTKK